MKSSPPVSVAGRVFQLNFIASGVFDAAGQPVPDDVQVSPKFLQFLLKNEVKPKKTKDAERPPRNLAYKLNELYSIDSGGYRVSNRHVERQVAEMLGAEQERDLIEAALNEPPNETVAAAMELAQADHAADVARQIAEGECFAKRRDEAEAWCKERQDADVAQADSEGFVQPSTEILFGENSPVEDTPKPQQKLRRRYVRRGSTWLRAVKVATKPGENIFVRNAPGKFEKIGVVGSDGRLPAAYQTKGES